MVNQAYVRGRSFEHERVHYHRSNGAYLAVRIAGSRGPWDVLALYPTRVVLEQCKRLSDLSPDMKFEKDLEFLSRCQVPPGVHTYLVLRGHALTRVIPVHRGSPPAPHAAGPAPAAPLPLTTPVPAPAQDNGP